MEPSNTVRPRSAARSPRQSGRARLALFAMVPPIVAMVSTFPLTSAAADPVSSAGVPAAACETRVDTSETKHAVCRFAPREDGERAVEVDFLHLKGPLEESAREHGRLLAGKIADGTARFVTESKAHLLAALPAGERSLYEGLLGCFIANYRASMPPSYVRLHENMALGMNDAGVHDYSSDALVEMSLSVELQALVATLKRQFDSDPLGALAGLAAKCGLSPAIPVLGSALEGSGGRTGLEWGCTGAVATRGTTADGSLIHARNVDSSALGFVERTPLVILHEPPGGLRYVGVASPGLHFSGGSSGFNEEGISASLHAVSTDDLRNRLFAAQGHTAFYLQNEILSEAASIDEAFAIVREAGRFTGWTMVVSDAKSGETAAIEWTASKAVLTRRSAKGFLAQTNHFQDPVMEGRDHAYSHGKRLESRFRLERVAGLLAKARGEVDAKWLMRLLGDQFDMHQGRRAFGRNVAKTFTTMAHVMEPTPSRRLFHMSLGDRLPVTLGRFLSFRVDFDAASRGRAPFALVALDHPRKGTIVARPGWTASQSRYVEAWMEHRDYGDSAIPRVVEKLDEAVALASKDGITEFPYLYMRARAAARESALVLADTASWPHGAARSFDVSRARRAISASIEDFNHILAWEDSEPGTLHPYDVANTHLWKARTLMLRGRLDGVSAWGTVRNAGVARHLAAAHALVSRLAAREVDPSELRRLERSYRDPVTGRFKPIDAKAFLAAPLDFVTVE